MIFGVTQKYELRVSFNKYEAKNSGAHSQEFPAFFQLI